MSALRSSAGPAVCTNGTPSSRGDDLRERRLAQPRRAGQQHVIERLAARSAAAIETPSCSRSASWPMNSSSRRGRARRRVVVRSTRASACAGDAGRREHARRADRSGRRRASRRAAAIRSSGVSPAAPCEQRVRLRGREAEPEQASRASERGSSPRGDRRSASSAVGHADLLAQLDDDPLRRALADARHGLKAARVPARRRQQLARRAAREHGQRDLRADRMHADQQQEQVALLLGGEAVQQQRVVAHDQVGVQRAALPDRGTWRSVSADTLRR